MSFYRDTWDITGQFDRESKIEFVISIEKEDGNGVLEPIDHSEFKWRATVRKSYDSSILIDFKSHNGNTPVTTGSRIIVEEDRIILYAPVSVVAAQDWQEHGWEAYFTLVQIVDTEQSAVCQGKLILEGGFTHYSS